MTTAMPRFATPLLLATALTAACGGGDGAKPDGGAAIPDSAIADGAGDAPGAVDAADAPRCPAPTVVAAATATPLAITGDPAAAMGIFDPSVVYPAGAAAGVLAYSAVPTQHTIRTRLAVSGDGGASWTFVAEANAPEAATLASSDPVECPGGACTGFLHSEVPSLIYDPTDPDADARWKLYAHRYLVGADDTLHYRLGTITVQTAPAPAGPWTAPAKLLGLPSSSPYTTAGVRVDAGTIPALADCLALTEPAALWLPGSIELALGCLYRDGDAVRIRVALVRSLDHGATWGGVGVLLGRGDADCLPGAAAGASVNAANLFVGADGRAYVAATSSDATYHGCAVFPIDDLASGHVARDGAGRATPTRLIIPDTGQFSGACTWSGGGGGYLLDVGYFATAVPFRVLRVGP